MGKDGWWGQGKEETSPVILTFSREEVRTRCLILSVGTTPFLLPWKGPAAVVDQDLLVARQ